MPRLRDLSALVLLAAGPATAQVTLDGTLGPAVPLEPPADPGHYVVEPRHGTTLGRNLFHSFSRFDVGPGQRVTFTGERPILNIIGRITGGRSTIAGTVESTVPGGNLFLLNPAGILFREGAQ